MKKEARKSQQEVIVTVLLILVGIACVVALVIVITKITKSGTSQAENNTAGIMDQARDLANNPPGSPGSGGNGNSASCISPNNCSVINSTRCYNNSMMQTCLNLSGCLIWARNQSCTYSCDEDIDNCSSSSSPPTPPPSYNPYNITNCTMLQDMNKNLTGNYIIMNDINCIDTLNWNSLTGFIPIGDAASPFTGSFNGKNHTISNLFINRTGEEDIGLFGHTIRANISNIGLTNINISGRNNVGGFIGYGKTNTMIKNCFVTGEVRGYDRAGGVLGRIDGSRVTNCYSEVNAFGTTKIGSFAGWIVYNSIVNNSYSTGNATGTNSQIGGFSGALHSSAKIENVFSTGKVSGSSYLGGLVGMYSGGIITNSYWNKKTELTPANCYVDGAHSGTPGNIGCIAIQNNESYFKGLNVNASQPMASWNFVNTWKTTSGYPVLRWQ